MLVLSLFTVLVVLGSVLSDYVRMEPTVQTFSSSNWLKEGALKSDDTVRALFVLKHDPAAVQQFEQHLLDIATPSSPRYGQWLKVSAQLNVFNAYFRINFISVNVLNAARGSRSSSFSF
jgi:hypothetical protein